MKRTRLFSFYATLLVPVGALAGIGAGKVVGAPALMTITGVGFGIVAAWALLWSTGPDETP